MSRASGLYRLQELDLERDRLNGRLDEIRRILEDSGELERLKSEATVREENSEAARAKARQAQHEVEDQRLKIQKTEQALYGGQVRNPKELEDLQMEAESLKRHLETLEDRYLEAMITQDEAEAAHSDAAEALDLFEAELVAINSELIDEQKMIDQRLSDLSAEREVAFASVSEDDLQLYERLRARNRGVAVAGLNGDSCAACGLTLSASSRQLVRTSGDLQHCSQCGRILYGG